MTKVRIIGNRGSKAYKAIRTETGIQIQTKQTDTDVILNYGLNKDKIERLCAMFRSIRNIPVINKYVGKSKYRVVRDASANKITVPETKMSLSKDDIPNDWIEKRVHSSQGYGIKRARGRDKIPGKYYQKFVKNRTYELRVHAFAWIPKDLWSVHKRSGSADKIAWNFHQGGNFSRTVRTNVTERAKTISEKILKLNDMSFGAVDFIVDKNDTIYFIEINSCPGFTTLSNTIYINAVNKLMKLPANIARSFGYK